MIETMIIEAIQKQILTVIEVANQTKKAMVIIRLEGLCKRYNRRVIEIIRNKYLRRELLIV